MSVEIRSGDRRRYSNEIQLREKEIAAGLLKVTQPSSPKALQENEKRMRREIANSNERRRMQCINAGFSNLRALIPQLEGEKLSKAAILQHTTEYITNLEKEKSRLQSQLDHTKRLLSELGQDRAIPESYMSSSPPPSKRKKRDTESSDEGVGMMSDGSDDGGTELQLENVSLRHQLETQKQQCAVLEDRNRLLEAQLLSLLQVQASHTSSVSATSERLNVSMEARQLHHTGLYSQEVADVTSSSGNFDGSPRMDTYQPPRPMSPTPERGMLSEPSSSRKDSTSPGYLLVSSPPCSNEPISYALKVEAAYTETGNKGTVLSTTPSAIVSALTSTGADQPPYSHHHNYCHRDHPRRRHRQQAQLEQQKAEEEMRRQQEQASLPQMTFRPKPNTQNLENLVEAIRQIEGDRIMCDDQKFYDSDIKQYEKRPLLTHSKESERELCMSDQEEFKSESSGQDSPHVHPDHHFIPSQKTHVLCSSQNLSRCSSSEKYPIATHLLHRPIYPSYCRPGVIVQKQ